MGRKPSLQLQPLSLAEPGPGASGITPGHAACADGAETHSQQRTTPSAAIPPVSATSQRQSPWSSRFATDPKIRRPQTGKETSKSGNDFQSRPPPVPPQSSNYESFLDLSPTVPSPYYDESSAAPSPTARDGSKRSTSKSGFFHFAKPSPRGHGAGQLEGSNAPRTESRDKPHSGGSNETSVSQYLPYSHDPPNRAAPSIPSRSELSLPSTIDPDVPTPPSPGKRSKTKSFGLLSRSKSNRDKDYAGYRGVAVPEPLPAVPNLDSYDKPPPAPPRTAPVAIDRSFRDMMNSSQRNRSEDRASARDSSREKEPRPLPSSLKENGSFFSGLRNSSTQAAHMISKGLFGKSGRSGSTTEREQAVDDEHYVLKVINLPLVEQTRKTRISKRLETSRDKTEFWMPAFPWRAIDYLNYKGCDVEGLYRVPGSGPQIKKWQRKFDEQYDVNLFEENDLYDINIIGSMLKAWLRELPDELFPKEAQDRVARECAGATEVPQMLIDELSNLTPFNYYLLFAITCHLSLLLAHSDKNKMDFRNLCICFQPCMKIDAFCFKFLVCDWRECWQGCKTESKYIEEEYRQFDQPPPRGVTEPHAPRHSDDLADSDSARSEDIVADSGVAVAADRMKHLQMSDGSDISRSEDSSNAQNATANSKAETPERKREMRPLSPIQPLSPLGL